MTYRQQVLRTGLLSEGYCLFRLVRRRWLWRVAYDAPSLMIFVDLYAETP